MGITTHIADFRNRLRTGFASAEEYDKAKQLALEQVLGPMHGFVGHAIIPYAIGGPVDMYYFPQPDGGTAFATMELLNFDGSGPAESDVGTYELVAFTKHAVVVPDRDDPFDAIEHRLRSLFTSIGRFSEEAVLNSGDTAEVPVDDDEPNACILFSALSGPAPFRIGKRTHGLLVVTEVLPDEMALSREHGSAELITRLTRAGYFPKSDLDRESVAGT
jgi:hypothetical protein